MNVTRRPWTPARSILGAICAMVICSGLSACSSSDDDKDGVIQLKVATYQPKGLAATNVLDWYTSEVEKRSDGRIKFHTYYSETLVKAADMLDAVGNGQVDVGYTANIYHESELPLTTIVELPGLAKNSLAQSKALMELYANNKDFQKEYTKNGVHLLYTQAIGENIIGSKTPITSADSLKGVSIRAVGYTAKALAAVGANPVELTSPEIYEAVARGTVDAYSSTTLDGVSGLDLQDHTKYVTGGWYGAYATGPVVMNEEVFQSLPKDLQKVVSEVGAGAADQNAKVQAEADKGACDKLLAAKVVVQDAPVEVTSAWQQEFDKQIVTPWVKDRTSQGADGQTFFDQYKSYLDEASQTSDYQPAVAACAAASQ